MPFSFDALQNNLNHQDTKTPRKSKLLSHDFTSFLASFFAVLGALGALVVKI